MKYSKGDISFSRYVEQMKITSLPTASEIEEFFDLLGGGGLPVSIQPIEDAKSEVGRAQIVVDNNSRHLGKVQAIYGKLE